MIDPFLRVKVRPGLCGQTFFAPPVNTWFSFVSADNWSL